MPLFPINRELPTDFHEMADGLRGQPKSANIVFTDREFTANLSNGGESQTIL